MMWRRVVLFFFLFSFFACCFFNIKRTRARGEKNDEMFCFVPFFFPERETCLWHLSDSPLFLRTNFHTHTHKKNTNMSIQEYIETHNLSKRVEETINAAVKAKAPEPISFMVGRVWVF